MDLTPEQKELVDLAARVPSADIPVAKRVLAALIGDSLWQAIETAPYDDEEVTSDDHSALEEAENEFRRGESTSHLDVLREYGLR